MAVGLPEIEELMRRYQADDQEKKSVEAEGESLDDALKNASIQLDCPIIRIEYVVFEPGSPGVFGFGKRPCKLRATTIAEKQKVAAVEETVDDSEFSGDSITVPEIRDRDGEAFVRLSGESALLKVIPPVGKGRRATDKHATDRLHARAVHDCDENMVREIVRNAEGEYVKVGSYISNPANDGFLTCDVTDSDMKAFVVLTQPGPGGADLSREAISFFLKNNKIMFGIKDEVLQDLEDRPHYKEPVLVAEGDKPQNGRDARMQFLFEVDKTKLHLKESADGRVNFKELGLIQNVVAGQPLARKVPPERGVSGKTVLGRPLPARNGKDIQIPAGKNVHIAEDGLTVIADINGEVTFMAARINVETVKTIEGDLDIKVGNQMFLGGTLIIKGNIEDGFEVKAAGDIEVYGNVGRSTLVAEGDVIVHQGINGKSNAIIKAGRSVWARFIEMANIEAGEYVIASDGIVNSNVTANKKIICQGRRAYIVGGHYRACEEINAKSLGSAVSGAETICEVGFDPKSKEKLEGLNTQLVHLKHQLDELDKNLSTMVALKKLRKEPSEEKDRALQVTLAKRGELIEEMRNLAKEAESIQAYLNGLKTRGRVSVSYKVYPGVKIQIKDVREDIKIEQKAVTFYLENLMIKKTKYEEVDDESIRRGPHNVDKTD
ncbi:MAG: FapA family protein [Spirochaetes bacterium]|nr:FapA family protein [Spirochaetota bacterium]